MSLNFLSRHESLCARNTAAFAVNVSRVRISKLLPLVVCWVHLMVRCSHCPWVWNCGAFWIYLFEFELTSPRAPPVGLNNHRQFIIFVTSLVIGIVLFDYLTWSCEYLLSIFPRLFTNILLPDFSSLEDSPTTSPTCFLPASVCLPYSY